MKVEDTSRRDPGGDDTIVSPRKPYETPELVVYGDLAAITRSNNGTHNLDGAGHPNRHFTS